MKTALLIIVILVISCGPEPDGIAAVDVVREVHNESGYPVQIRSYFNAEYSFKIVEYNLQNDEGYTETGIFYRGDVGGGGTVSTMEWRDNVDSVLVIFDDLRIAKHCADPGTGCIDLNRSIILDYGFSGVYDGYIKQEGTPEKYIYTITKEDFNNAKMIVD